MSDATPKAVSEESKKAGGDPNNIKACVYCGSEIPGEAIVCPICKYHQAAWKNSLIMIGGMAGLLALLLSSASFILNNAFDMVARSNWSKSVNIHYLQTGLYPDFKAIFSNSSVESVYISEIVIYWVGGANATFRVDKAILPKQFITVESGGYLGVNQYVGFAYNKSGRPNAQLEHNSALDTNVTVNRQCFLEVFYTEDASDITRMTKHYGLSEQKLISEPVEAHLVYFRAATGEKVDVKFAVVRTFNRSANPTCSGFSLD